MWASWRAMTVAAVFSGAIAACAGCDEAALQSEQADAGPAAGGLTRQQAQTVVAQVGKVSITLGDFAAALERMNQFDRLRYQTKQRRRALLDEMVDMELLAQEAKRRGLDQRPEVQEAIRQILRSAILAQARVDVPPPATISAAEVQDYYEANIDRFREPERRRVAVIVMGDEVKAGEVLEQAKALTSGAGWGALYFDHSLSAPDKPNEHAPADLAGDLGIVGPPDDPKGANKAVPDVVRRAAFRIGAVGQVHGAVVSSGNRHYIVRLAGLTKGHTRTLKEADRVIRGAILEAKIKQREKQLEEHLRQRFPVQVDDAALADVKLPEALEGYKPFWREGAPSQGGDE